MSKYVMSLIVLAGLNLAGAKHGAADSSSSAQEGILKKGDRIAIIGDSITEQKIYSRFIETYLLACVPQLDLQVIQFGWGGEAAPGILDRLENDVIPWQPDVATLCYGMNDGAYVPYDDEIGQRFETNMEKVVSLLRQSGTAVVISSPGAVDPNYFPSQGLRSFGKNVDGDTYNKSLEQLGGLSRAIAQRHQATFADLHQVMLEAMVKLKNVHGAKAIYAGDDGIHPWDNGHLAMAYTFLKGLGLGGQIGTLTLDMKKKSKGTASEGHRVVDAAAGRLEIKSSRYPFCFAKTNSINKETSGTARELLPFLPFNEELNRLTLRVTGMASGKATVRWGEQSKAFTRQQLEEGINLAAEFLDNPFSEAFAQVDKAVARKESYETFMIKDLVTHFRSSPWDLRGDKEFKQTISRVREKLIAEDDRLHEAARDTIRPVHHTILVIEE